MLTGNDGEPQNAKRPTQRSESRAMNNPMATMQDGRPPTGEAGADSLHRFVGRLLVACEFSGVVRDAFHARGWDAYSCDLLPNERGGKHHQRDVREILNDGWDMMIAHPPCTYLANSGARWLFEKPGRWKLLDEACAFFCDLMNAPIKHVAIENPWPHKWALERIGRKPDCKIQPWEFGHEQKKQTCLWLRGLPILLPDKVVGPPPKDGPEAKRWEAIWREPPGENQAKNRSRTFTGIAAAMAKQWGDYAANAEADRRRGAAFGLAHGSRSEERKT